MVTGVSKLAAVVHADVAGGRRRSVTLAGVEVGVERLASPWLVADNEAIGATADMGGAGVGAFELLCAHAPWIKLGGGLRTRGFVVLSSEEALCML